MNIAGPTANFITLGYLKPWLLDRGWLFSLCILGSTAFFREEHKYQGVLGFANSWFLGMFFFYMMLTHGLFAAICAHFFYNMACTVAITITHKP